jgi:uncharacterized tellurite resistance protein B-like protein
MLLIAAAAALLCIPAPVLRAQDDIHVLYQEGRDAFFTQQYELAREKLAQVLARSPNHPQTRAMMAQIEQKIGADNTMLRKAYEKIVIDKFEVAEAELSEAITAVKTMAKNATGGKVVPNIIVRDAEIGKKPVTLTLAKMPLSEVLKYLAQLTGAKLTYDKNAAIFSNPASTPAPAPTPAG